MPGITIIVSTVLSLLGLAIAFFYMKKVTSVPLTLGLDEKDASRLTFIHGAIAQGAMAFLRREYMILAVFVAVVTVIIAALIDFNITDNATIDSQPTTADDDDSENNNFKLLAGKGDISFNADIGARQSGTTAGDYNSQLGTFTIEDTTGSVIFGGADLADQAGTLDLAPVTQVRTNGAIAMAQIKRANPATLTPQPVRSRPGAARATGRAKTRRRSRTPAGPPRRISPPSLSKLRAIAPATAP